MDNVQKQSPEELGLTTEPPRAIKYKKSLIKKVTFGLGAVVIISIYFVINNSEPSKVEVEEQEHSFEPMTPKMFSKEKGGVLGAATNTQPENARIVSLLQDGSNATLHADNVTQKIDVAKMVTSEHNSDLLREYFEQQALVKIKEIEGARLSPVGFSVANLDLKAGDTDVKSTASISIETNSLASRLLKSGSIIPCVLITAVNSDLPGMVVARIRENVFDTATGRHLLLPQGSVLTGVYSSNVNFGQERAQISFKKVNLPASSIYPEGHTIDLEALQGIDLAGHTGLRDRVDNHYDKVAVGVSLSSLLAAASKDPDGSTYRDRALNKTSENISAIGQKIADKQLNQSPTITIRGGTPFNIMVNKDLALTPINEEEYA